MIYEKHRLSIPSSDEYSIPQLRMMLVEGIVGRAITVDDWSSLA